MQDCWAAWNVGELGSTPGPGLMAPVLSGSGNSGTPWARMHAAYAGSEGALGWAFDATVVVVAR